MLPGVAIAISLVPPLAVVGVCLGQGAFGLSFGAFLLFLSNVLAMVLAGVLTFALLWLRHRVGEPGGRAPAAAPHRPRRALCSPIGVPPLAANTLVVYQLNVWEGNVQDTTEDWLRDTPGAEVAGVDFASTTATINIRHTGDLPAFDDLMADLDDVLPDGIHVVVDTTVGRRSDLGVMGE